MDRLGYYRSIGYPTFLNIVKGVWDSLSRRSQQSSFGTYFLSVYLFWFALWRYSGSRWLAFAASFPLPWAAVMELVNRIQPDFLSAAATVFAIALVFLLATKPRHLLTVGWSSLYAVVAAYHSRPAAVFLVGFVPLIGGMLVLDLESEISQTDGSSLVVLLTLWQC